MKTTLVSYDQFSALDFIHPATYYIRLATGDYLYIHSRDRAKVQEFINEEFGNQYQIRASRLVKGKAHYDGFTVTARG